MDKLSDVANPQLWRFRYRFAGKPRVMNLGSYAVLPLSDARKPGGLLRPELETQIRGGPIRLQAPKDAKQNGFESQVGQEFDTPRKGVGK